MAHDRRHPPPAHRLAPRADLARRLATTTAPIIVLVAGPGWGKTTALASLAEGRRTAWLTLVPAHAAMVDLLPALVAALADAGAELPPRVAGLAAQATGPEAGDGSAAERIAGELVAGLRPADGDLLVLDGLDVLPTGSAGLQLLDAVLRRLPPVAQVALAARDHLPLDLAGRRERGEVLDLDATALRLAPEETADVVADLLGGDPLDVPPQVHELTGGWPGAVRLVAESLRDLDATGRAELLAGRGRGRTAVARYVATAVLDRLPSTLRVAVHLLADLGAVEPRVCAHLGLPVDALDELAARGLVTGPDGDGRLALSPVVVLATALATRPSGVQVPDRDAVLDALVAEGQPARALRTAVTWRDLPATARLLDALGPDLLAGGEVGALAEAAALVPPERRSPEVEEVLGQALMVRGDWSLALQCLHRAAAGADPLPVRVAWRLGLIHYLRGEVPAALAVYDSAEEPRPDDWDSALLLAFEACARWVGGQLDAARRAADRAFAVATHFGDPHTLSAVHTALAMIAAADGDRVRVERHYADGLACTLQVGGVLQEVRLRSNHASHLVDEGRYAQAAEELDIASDLADLTGFAVLRLLIGSNRSDVLRRLGDLDGAEAEAREAEALGRDLGTGLVLYPQLALAEVHRARGDIERARRGYARVAQRAREVEDVQSLVPALAGAAVVAGDPAEARQLAEEAVRRSTGTWRLPARLALGWVELHAGDVDAAAEHASWVRGEAQVRGFAAAEAEALELLAAAGPEDRAVRLQGAAALWRQLDATLDDLRVQAALATLGGGDDRGVEERRRAKGVWPGVGEVAGLDRAAAGWRSGTEASTGGRRVAIRTFGGFAVTRPDGDVPSSGWRSRKARDLLRILVARRGSRTSRSVLADLLWPGEDPDRVSNRLSAAMSVVRGVLDPEKAWDPDHLVAADPSAIWLRTDHVDVDLERFHRELVRLRGATGAEAEAELEAATRLYAGEFMADEPFEDWAVAPREEARAAYLGALRTLVRMAQARGDVDAAISRSLRLLAEDPYDEDAYGHLIGICTGAGRHGEAQRHYHRYVAQMRRLGVQPMPFRGVSGLRGIA